MSDKAVSLATALVTAFIAVLVLAPAACFSWYTCVWLLAHAKVILNGMGS